MKIIGKSNFDNERVDDILIAENIRNEFYASVLVAALNDIHGEDAPYFFKVVLDSYELYSWEP